MLPGGEEKCNRNHDKSQIPLLFTLPETNQLNTMGCTSEQTYIVLQPKIIITGVNHKFKV